MRNTFVPALLSVLVLGGLTACASGSALADAPAGRCFPGAIAQSPFPRCPPSVASPRIEVVDESGSLLPSYLQDGRVFVQGETGSRYLVRIVNPSPRRVEAVVSVDGLDAVDGKPASVGKRGYLVPAFGNVTIDGWRTSMSSVAAFRFSSVRDSYAGRTGHDRNVGVIGVAFFRERVPPPRVQPKIVQAYPAPPSAEAATRSADQAPAGRSGGGAGGSSAPSPSKAEAEERPGLGTEYGEAHTSEVEEVSFVRAESSPSIVQELRYDDRDGLQARGIPVYPRDDRDDETRLRDTAQPFAERFAQPPP
jgi:hypothetical protein